MPREENNISFVSKLLRLLQLQELFLALHFQLSRTTVWNRKETIHKARCIFAEEIIKKQRVIYLLQCFGDHYINNSCSLLLASCI